MKGLRLLGDVIFEYLIITLILILSICLVIPCIPVFVGVIAYLRLDINTRTLRDFWMGIKENIKILIPYSIFELTILAFSILNLYFFLTHPEKNQMIVLILSYIALFIGIVFFIHAPIIILTMKVNFRQLMYNSIMLIFGGIFRSILTIVLMIGIAFIAIYFPHLLFFLPYFIAFVIAKMIYPNFYVLKARALKTTPQELLNQEQQDAYLDEYGQVDHSK